MALDLSVNSEVRYSNNLCESDLCEKWEILGQIMMTFGIQNAFESIINFEKRKFQRVRFLQKRTLMTSIYSEWHEPGNDFSPKRKRSLGNSCSKSLESRRIILKAGLIAQQKNVWSVSFENDLVNF